MKNTIKLFLAAAVVALAASCSSKPSEQEAVTAPEETVAPAEVATDTVEVSSDTTQVID